jgi:opacity protein-like surface antigen
MKIVRLALLGTSLTLLVSPSAFAQATPRRCTLSQHPCSYPHLSAAVDGGVSHFAEGGPFGFGTGLGSITAWGPAWGLRIGVELLPWFAVDAHYIGAYNRADTSVSVGGRRGLLTSAAAAEARFTVPLRYVQPYLFLGAGAYTTSISGSSDSTELNSSTEFGVPIGVGVSVPLAPGLSLGPEVTYHRWFGESLAADDELGGGDPFTANAVLRAHF